MISEVTMPSMGADMSEGTIVKWLKKEGDQVKRGDKLAEIETDKTVVEMECYNDGILKKIIVQESNVNDIINIFGEPSTKSSFDNDVWIYIERKISNTHFCGKRKLIVNNVMVL